MLRALFCRMQVMPSNSLNHAAGVSREGCVQTTLCYAMRAQHGALRMHACQLGKMQRRLVLVGKVSAPANRCSQRKAVRFGGRWLGSVHVIFERCVALQKLTRQGASRHHAALGQADNAGDVLLSATRRKVPCQSATLCCVSCADTRSALWRTPRLALWQAASHDQK